MKIFKTILLSASLMSMSVVSQAQDTIEAPKGYEFTDVYEVPYTPVKNQYRSGTCWAFAGIGFLESEILRIGGDTTDLSEMFIVRNIYPAKATKFVQLHGKGNLSEGGGFSDVLYAWKKYGLMPEEKYSGLEYGTDNHIHGELVTILSNYADGVVKNKNRKLTPIWKNGVNRIMDVYFGEVPVNFTFEGKEYSPVSYGESLGINPDDYVEITSYTHHPYYSEFALEIPDNWLWSNYYNVPLEDLTKIMDYALKKGYPVGWDADVSEKGFAYSKGLALIPDEEKTDLSGTEKEKWEKLTAAEKKKALYNFDEIVKEKTITPESRQANFDNYTSKDDHLMLITALAENTDGTPFYKVKNSWDTTQKYGGFFYASTPYIQDKTISILVHKDAIPKKIRKKLGIKK